MSSIFCNVCVLEVQEYPSSLFIFADTVQDFVLSDLTITVPSLLIFCFYGLGTFYWFPFSILIDFTDPTLGLLASSPTMLLEGSQKNKTNVFNPIIWTNYESIQSFPSAPTEPMLLHFLNFTILARFHDVHMPSCSSFCLLAHRHLPSPFQFSPGELLLIK